MYLVGIDVGGTNTDSVLIDASIAESTDSIVSWNKQLTTNDVSLGIETSLSKLFDKFNYKDEVLSITIGTTHFINAIVERDQSKLDKVAVIRLCGPYSHNVPPFADFPSDLTNLISVYNVLVDGGYHVDGGLIKEINELEIINHAKRIKELGISSIAITGIFSAVYNKQELKVAEILQNALKNADIVMSHELGDIGLLERENLTILNASIKRFANKTIKSFEKAVKVSDINAPILLTQNDGTVLTIDEALKIPIKTFSSGTTNSMRGASFLLNRFENENVIVVDVGGTTTDVGLLLSNGYPRKTSSYSFIGGVRTKLSMPQVESIGLGGGSIVRDHGDHVSIGPDSIGNDYTKSLINGGEVITTTDLSNLESTIYEFNSTISIKDRFSNEFMNNYSNKLSIIIENVIDRMKTSPTDIPVLLVGGGSFILPNKIKGASEVYRPKYYQVANAIGAAIGKISATSQSFGNIKDKDSIIESLKCDVFKKAIENGALENTIKIIDMSIEEVPYVDLNKFEIKVIADIDYLKLKDLNIKVTDIILKESYKFDEKIVNFKEEEIKIDYSTYKPTVINKEWIINEIDLEFFKIGTYILGCGGGGNPYSQYLIGKNLLKKGLKMSVVDVDYKDDYSSISVGNCGSPTVAHERLQGSELIDAYNLLNESFEDIETCIALEIGGGNGFQSLIVGAELNKKIVDADLMGRAYPMIWQITPVISDESFFSPCAFSDGNGTDIIIKKVKSNKLAETLVRNALSELGSFVGLVYLLKDSKSLVIRNSLSLAWRIGKAVSIAKQNSDIINLPNRIIESIKPTSSKLIFEGKIIGVEKKLRNGYVFGEVIIEDKSQNKLRIPFQNENLLAELNNGTIASVPDLITVIDSDSGEAVGTPDYKYGLFVFVLVISPSNLWTDSQKGMEIGGPSAFGLDEINYTPTGEYFKPMSVIDEYSS